MRKLRYFFSCSIWIIFILPGSITRLAQAEENHHNHFISFRTGFSAGLWAGSFAENYAAVTSSIYITPAWGGTLFTGMGVGPFFVDWSPAYLAVAKLNGSASSNSNAYYLTLASLEIGFSLHKLIDFLPIEAYLGYDDGNMGFATGSQTQLSGDTWKVGADLLILRTGPYGHLGFRGELRRHFMNINNFGPVAVSNNTTTYYLGLLFMFGT